MKRGKIPIATVTGLVLSVKHIVDEYKAISESTPDSKLRNAHMVKVLTGYTSPELSAAGGGEAGFHLQELIPTYGPVVGGSMISKYVGGPKGLNVNAQLRSVPLFKL